MTRFMISLEEGVGLVWEALSDMRGGEIYVKKIPSMKVADIASVIAPQAQLQMIGIRPGEKLHEQMIGIEDAPHTYAYDGYFKILPAINDWSKDAERIGLGEMVPADFSYTSDNNEEWMTKEQLKTWIAENAAKIGMI